MSANSRLWFAVAAALLLSSCATIREYLPRNPLRAKATAGQVKRIAVLPVAFRSPSRMVACDLCPDKVVMDVTSEDDATLVTAFWYEALARHPRIQVVPYEHVRAAEGESMRDTLTRLAASEKLDAVLIGSLLELRERRGDPRAPYQRAGAAMYAALLDLPSGRPVWKRYYDHSPQRAGRAVRQYQRLVIGEESKPMTAHEVAEVGVGRMVSSLVRSIR